MYYEQSNSKDINLAIQQTPFHYRQNHVRGQ